MYAQCGTEPACGNIGRYATCGTELAKHGTELAYGSQQHGTEMACATRSTRVLRGTEPAKRGTELGGVQQHHAQPGRRDRYNVEARSSPLSPTLPPYA
eukprot:1339900-Rhodomonas_salina.2